MRFTRFVLVLASGCAALGVPGCASKPKPPPGPSTGPQAGAFKRTRFLTAAANSTPIVVRAQVDYTPSTNPPPPPPFPMTFTLTPCDTNKQLAHGHFQSAPAYAHVRIDRDGDGQFTGAADYNSTKVWSVTNYMGANDVVELIVTWDGTNVREYLLAENANGMSCSVHVHP
jgi:hypothetical protein